MKKIKVVIFGIFCIIFVPAFTQIQNTLDFDGMNDYVSVPGGGALNNLQTGTIEMWVKWSGIQSYASPGFGPVLARQCDYFFSNQIIEISLSDPSIATVVWVPYDCCNVAITGSIPVGDNQWAHVAITYASGDHKLYINGVLDGTSSMPGSMQNYPTIPHDIGAWIVLSSGGCSKSQIDELRIWNTIRTQQEIRDNMYKEISYPQTNLLAYYRFNQTSGSTGLPDLSGNGYDGTLTNMDPSTDWVSSTAPIPYFTVLDGNWNENSTWAEGENVPVNSWSNVKINNIVNLNANVTVNDMTIASSGLTVLPGKFLTVNGNLTINAGVAQMTIKSTGIMETDH